MAADKNTPGNLTGTLTPVPKSLAGFFKLKALIIAALNCTFRTRYFIQLSDGQNYQGTQEADVVCGPQGKTVTFKSIAIPGATGSGAVPFSGAGAPTATTLAAGNYVAAPTPSLYVDLTNKVLYACTTAGTAATSVWSSLGGTAGAPVAFLIQSDGGDYWNCLSLTNVATKVAKPYKLRASNGLQNIRGFQYHFTFATPAGAIYLQRSSVGSDGSVETDVMIPDPLLNDIIYALPFTNSEGNPFLFLVNWIDINADGRAWTSLT